MKSALWIILIIFLLVACTKDDQPDKKKKTPFENRESLYRKWWYVTRQSMIATSDLYLINDTTLAVSFRLGSNVIWDSAIFKYKWLNDSIIVNEGIPNHIIAYSDTTLKTYIGDTVRNQYGTSGTIYYSTKGR